MALLVIAEKVMTVGATDETGRGVDGVAGVGFDGSTSPDRPPGETPSVIRDTLAAALRSALSTLEIQPIPESVHLERPARREHGDWSSNIALATAKAAGWNPRELAGRMAEILNADLPAHVTSVEIAGPGFVNFRLADSWLHDVLVDVENAGIEKYATSSVGTGIKVLLEFVSANPTGPLHAGHGRGAAYGDSLARILQRCGYDVDRENYLNDRGTQMQLFVASLIARRDGTPLPEGGYQGEYIVDWAAELPADADVFEWGEERAVADHRLTLSRMNVEFDNWFSEKSMVASGAIDVTLADLRERGVVYEEGGAVWLRSTDYGDDKDRVLIKSDGEFTYLLPDIAYHRDKFARGYDLLIDVWGADHHGYVPRMKAAMQSLGHDPAELECAIIQLVNLLKGGEPVRFSKRAGDIVELSEVLDEVGADAARLTYLLQSIDSTQTFDYDVVKSRAMDNPVYYVQMAYARIQSIFRVAVERSVATLPSAQVDFSLLVHERELEVLRVLSELPDTVSTAAVDRAPHRIATWVRELAGAVHGFYHDCYVMGDGVSGELTQARLHLVEAAAVGLAIGLDLLGVSAPDQM
ncbi:MAG: arginine--tRNA ligase [Actinobacteria bacterium]|uniref:arginine--tRNA ligase n=3 Tax=freshwater metagenome TaxID=449393 RepID=A0A6J7MGM2_9ZZZZ|nr:arginine--tRNA ligase [Actinomycetota bacterium]MSW31858.1 arginine--tRNA ligase [Actinomycetota bacterium]MSX34498.1 arginine--tRNA ligase [Actinomycetota bacterium]MSY24997.1 arginine--tRNA ligase [Actinomycetota bacterium]MSY33812.1 arginine--tRNA ligase [Actinomycetota bacterium]